MILLIFFVEKSGKLPQNLKKIIGPSQELFCGLAYLNCMELNPDHEHIISLLFDGSPYKVQVA